MSGHTCKWCQDGDPDQDVWLTECGEGFCLSEGTPFEHGMRYCCYCGGDLREWRLVWDDDGFGGHLEESAQRAKSGQQDQ